MTETLPTLTGPIVSYDPTHTFFISDLHIGHQNILHLGPGRPFDTVEEMADTFRRNWWSAITDEDTVFVMGDIAMGIFKDSIQFYKNLPGKKLLIIGNHDKLFKKNPGTDSWNRFAAIYESVGFTIIPETVVQINLTGVTDGIPVLLSHFPRLEPAHEGRPDRGDKFARWSPSMDTMGQVLIHGHTHATTTTSTDDFLAYHIGVDANNWAPVKATTIQPWITRVTGTTPNANLG